MSSDISSSLIKIKVEEGEDNAPVLRGLLGPEEKSKLYKLVSERLKEVASFSDDVLTEYIIVMVQNQKTRSQVTKDLEAFLGNQAQSFSIWLWDVLRAILTSPSHMHSTAREPIHIPSSIHIPEHSVFTSNRGADDSLTVKDQHVASSHRQHRTAQPKPERGEAKPSIAPEYAKSSARLFMAAAQEAAKSITQTAPTRKRKRDAPQQSSDEPRSPTSPRNGEASVDMSPRGRDWPHDRGGDRMQVEPSGGVDDSAEGEAMSGNSDNDESTHDDSEVSEQPPPAKRARRERCQYWPMCTRGSECKYIHPSKPCKLFPRCPFGAECLYIHPSVQCRYGAACMRPSCPFDHPPPTALKPPCRYGFACRERMDGCAFGHPLVACKFAERCTRGIACRFSHAALCRYGAECKTPDCQFAHPYQLDRNESERGVEQESMLEERLSSALPDTP